VATRGGPVGFLVDEVVRVLRYDPAACVPETTRLSGYVTASFQALGGSWLLIDWDAIPPPGRDHRPLAVLGSMGRRQTEERRARRADQP
jgi:hypothetical protein